MSNKESIGKALGRIPSGISILTYHNNTENASDGILVSWMQQLSFEPPMVVCAVGKDRAALNDIKANKKFVINILGNENKSLMISCAKNGQQALASGEIKINTVDQNTIILEEALVSLELELVDLFQSESADHYLMTAKVINAHLNNLETDEPMIHLRASGFSY